MFGGNLRRSACPIGIDVSARRLRVMQLSGRVRDPYQFVITGMASRNFSAPCVTDSDRRLNELRDALQGALQSGSFTGKDVVLSLCASDVQFKNLRVPASATDKMQQVITKEASQRVYFDAERSDLQYIDAGEVVQGEERRREILVITVAKDIIQRYMDVLTALNLCPVALEVSPTALARCLFAMGQAEKTNIDDAMFSVDIGEMTTNVLVQRGSQVFFEKQLNIGSAQLNEAVSKVLGTSVEEAVSRRIGNTADGSEAESSGTHISNSGMMIRDAIKPVVDDLSREVQLCLRYCGMTFRGRRADKIFLMGEESRCEPLVNQLREAVGVPVETPRALASIDLHNSKLAQPMNRSADNAVWAVAAGASMFNAVVPVTTVGDKEAAA